MKKILFLDVDGVLNSELDRGNKPTDVLYERLGKMCGISKFHVEQLKRLLDAIPDLEIVLSSTWRIQHANDLVYGTNELGVPLPLIGITPSVFSGNRGYEITSWLCRNLEKGEPVIVGAVDDDHDIQYADSICRPFYTTWERGLQPELVDEMITYFSGKPQPFDIEEAW